MASYGQGYGGQKHHGSDDSYGNPVRQTDEYGNPIQQHTTGGGTMGEYGTGELTGPGATGTHGTHGTGAHGGGLSTATHGLQSKLHRSGSSSSSSSSEDDGMGGRRKKGIKDKIKDKLPGGHNKEQQQSQTTTPHITGGSYATGEYGATAAGEQPYEKKGVMEKIKEKLPGGR